MIIALIFTISSALYFFPSWVIIQCHFYSVWRDFFDIFCREVSLSLLFVKSRTIFYLLFFTFFFNLHFWKIILLTIELLLCVFVRFCIALNLSFHYFLFSVVSDKRFTIKNLFSVSVGPSFSTFLLLLRFSIWACSVWLWGVYV